MVGAAAIASLIYTKGSVDVLVTMYAINVFVTFSLSQIGMTRFSWARRKRKGGGDGRRLRCQPRLRWAVATRDEDGPDGRAPARMVPLP